MNAPRKKTKLSPPAAPLAKIKTTGAPFYAVIARTANQSFSGHDTFNYMRDQQQSLVEEAIAIVLDEYEQVRMSIAQLKTRTEAVCRKLIRREKVVFRNGLGKRQEVHRLVHPKLVIDEETGDRFYHSPIDDIVCDATGAKVPYSPPGKSRNIVEDRMVESIYAKQIAARMQHADALFVLDYVDRRRRDAAISDADRQRFHRVREQVLATEK